MSFIYNFLIFLILISAIYEFVSDNPPSKIWFRVIIFMMIMTAGLAYGISPDWVAYWKAFEASAQGSFLELGELSVSADMEIGYILLNKIVSFFGLGYGSFTLIIAAIALSLKSSSIFKYSGYVFLGLLMYTVPSYFFEEQVHVRQGIANAIMLFSARYIVERKFWKFFLCFVIAFLFHKAVIAFFFAYWIAVLRYNNVTIMMIVGLTVAANIFGLTNVIDSLFRLLPFGVGETYSDYANETWEGGILGDIAKILTVIIILIFNNATVKRDEYFSYFRNIFLFGVILYFFFGKGIFSSRLPGFYTVYIIFVIPRIIKALTYSPMFKNLMFISFTVYTILLYVNFYNNWGSKSGFGQYKTSLYKWAPYGFFQSK